MSDLIPTDLASPLSLLRRRAVSAAASGFPDLGALLSSLLPDPLDPFVLLPAATGRAAGGSMEDVAPACVAVLLLNVSLRIVDDCADQDNPGSLDRKLGVGPAMNVAMALSTIAIQEVVAMERRSGLPSGSLDHTLRALVAICHGQARDMGLPAEAGAATLDDYKSIVALKTVRAYELAAALGARAVCADAGVIARAALCGVHLGWMTQILDDIEALWFPVAPALRERRATFPLLYGLSQDSPESARLRALVERGQQNSAKARSLLDKMDVRRRLFSIALDHRDAALRCLERPIHKDGHDILKLWLDFLLRGGERLLGGKEQGRARPKRARRSQPGNIDQ